jgi:SpoIID/LytB domain protein
LPELTSGLWRALAAPVALIVAAGIAFVTPTASATRGADGRDAADGTAGGAQGSRLSGSSDPTTAADEAAVASVPLLPSGALTTQDGSSSIVLIPVVEAAEHGLATFSAVGLTWDDPAAQPTMHVQVRTRSAGRWATWVEVPHGIGHTPDAAESGVPTATSAPNSTSASSGVSGARARGGTDPLIVEPSDAVEVRLRPGPDGVPAGLRLELVHPGADPQDAALATSDLAPAAATIPGLPITVYSRAAWGANERLNTCCLSYGVVDGGFIHHTVSSNSYDAEDVPGILRAIHTFHVRSRGYRDIGYNFLVDRFGRIWEGRAGGVTRAVIGAHTLGYNDVAFAASGIGTYVDDEPSPAMQQAFARLFAWKLRLHGLNPLGTTTLHGKRFAMISGHRDANATECPGTRLYARLPSIRSAAAAIGDGGSVRISRTSLDYGDRAGVVVTAPAAAATTTWTLRVRSRCTARTVRTITGTLAAGSPLRVRWDAVDDGGTLVPPAGYDVALARVVGGVTQPAWQAAVRVRRVAGVASACPPRVRQLRVQGRVGGAVVRWEISQSSQPVTAEVALTPPGLPPSGSPALRGATSPARLTGLPVGAGADVVVTAVDAQGDRSVGRRARLAGARLTGPVLRRAANGTPLVRGRLRSDGRPLARRRVFADVRPADDVAWRAVASDRTSRRGTARVRLPRSTVGLVRLRFRGASGVAGVVSATADLAALPPARADRSDGSAGREPVPASVAQADDSGPSPGEAGDGQALDGLAAPRASGDARVRRTRTVSVVGRGWGHGTGMSQWGAYEAGRAGVPARDILRFYYPGTTLHRDERLVRVRVLLEGHSGASLDVGPSRGLALRLRTPSGRMVRRTVPENLDGCRPTTWRVVPDGSGLRVQGWCDRWVVWRDAGSFAPESPVAFVPDRTLVRVGSARGERTAYRGRIVVTRAGAGVRVVNVVRLEQYLRGVLPWEVPASWPEATLQAQAVAARTYALFERAQRAGQDFHVYDSTRSQVYRGARALGPGWVVVADREHPATDTAIAQTRGLVVHHEGAPAFTQFSSSNGGVTAGSALPYQVVQVDRWDAGSSTNPMRRWTRAVPVRDIERRYPGLGSLRRVRVLQRAGVGAWGGRVLRLQLQGSRSDVTLVGDSAVRAALGTPSSYLDVR